MTSSWALTKRKEMWRDWSISNFGDPENALGGWEDHYITPGHTHECHPNYEAIPIGNPYGFMVCKKRKYPNGQGLDTPVDPIDPSQFNGYNKYMADLYRPWRDTQIQTSDPYYYYDRTTPNEEFLHRNDYLARGIAYSGDGIKMVHTPGPRKYSEYGFAFTDQPVEKYEVSQLHQRYPVWKEEQIYHGASQQAMDRLDQQYTSAVPVSTW